MFGLWKKTIGLVLLLSSLGTPVSAEECNLKNCTLIEQNISCIASGSKVCAAAEMVCSMENLYQKRFEKLSTYSWIGLAVRPVLKKVLVMLGWAGEPTVRDQIDRGAFLKVMAFLSSDEMSFIATALSAFSFASFPEASYIASAPPVAILSYRILTDVYKVGHAFVDWIFNWFRGKDECEAQRPGYHWKTRLFGWIGFGAHTEDRKYDEDIEYLKKLDNCWVGDNTTLWGKFKKIFLGAPTRDTIREEKRATFEEMLGIGSLSALCNAGYDLVTLTDEGISLDALTMRGDFIESIQMMLATDMLRLPELHNAGISATDLITALFAINDQISEDDIRTLTGNGVPQAIVDDLLLAFNRRTNLTL